MREAPQQSQQAVQGLAASWSTTQPQAIATSSAVSTSLALPFAIS